MCEIIQKLVVTMMELVLLIFPSFFIFKLIYSSL